MRSSVQALVTPQTAMKAATAVTVAVTCTVTASEPVSQRTGVASQARPGKKACDGIEGRGCQ